MKKYLPIFISLTLICFIYKQYRNSLKQDKVDNSSIAKKIEFDKIIQKVYALDDGIRVTPYYDEY